MMWTQEDEHMEIVLDALTNLMLWAGDTGQQDEADAIFTTTQDFTWTMAREHLMHFQEWSENMGQPEDPETQRMLGWCDEYLGVYDD